MAEERQGPEILNRPVRPLRRDFSCSDKTPKDVDHLIVEQLRSVHVEIDMVEVRADLRRARPAEQQLPCGTCIKNEHRALRARRGSVPLAMVPPAPAPGS